MQTTALQQPEFLTLKGVAEDYFGGRVSIEAIRDWIYAGKLQSYRTPGGKIILIRRADLDALMAASAGVTYELSWMNGKRGRQAKQETALA
jgi:excisionase family DNA binding protein